VVLKLPKYPPPTEDTTGNPFILLETNVGVVPYAAVVLLPNPDLSYHFVKVAPLLGGDLLFNGSVASNHKILLANVMGENVLCTVVVIVFVSVTVNL
jgi:hypothetical protein